MKSSSFTKYEIERLRFQYDFYSWGHTIIKFLDKFILKNIMGVLSGFTGIPHYLSKKISDDVPVTKLDKINRILCYNVYRCIGLPFYHYHNEEIVNGVLVDSLESYYIKSRFEKMIDKLDPSLKAVVKPYFNKKYEENVSEPKYDLLKLDFLIEYYCLLRILGNFSDGTYMTRVIMYLGGAHINNLISIFIDLGIFDFPEDLRLYSKDLKEIDESKEDNDLIQCISIPVEENGYLSFEPTFARSTPSETITFVDLPIIETKRHEKLPISSISSILKRQTFFNEKMEQERIHEEIKKMEKERKKMERKNKEGKRQTRKKQNRKRQTKRHNGK